MKSVLVTLLLCSSLCIINASKLYVLKTPSFLKFDFSGEKSIKMSEFSNLVAATVGLGKSSNEFQGLKSQNPIKHPKVQIILLDDQESDSYGSSFIVNADIEDGLKSMGETLGKEKTLQVFYENIDSLVNAVESLKDLSKKCKDNHALVYTIKVDGDQNKLDKGVDQILNHFYQNCDSNDDNYLVYLMSEPTVHSRQPRQAIKATKNVTNKAVFYDANYPVTFNILFWSTLILALAIFGGAYLICTMDPGTDTVIYRMTSQRIKKDQ